MGGTYEGIGTTMEVDSIIEKVATKSIQITFDTIEATKETVHPLTLSIIIKIEEVTKNLQHGDETRIVPMVEYIVF
jgi:hypothetical protein